MHIYYTSKKPEVDYRCLEDSKVSLPLLFGVITYLLIIFSLTAWLTKYHKRQCQGTDPEDYLDTGEEHIKKDSISLQTKDFQTTTSGKQSIVKHD